MKKLLSILIVLLFIFSASASWANYTPGVYNSEAKGNNVDVPIKVQVTFDTHSITKIDVIAHEETPGLGDKAFEKVIPAIISAQSTEVDGMTGATMSSNAIKEAVDDCIAQASGAKSN